MSSSKTTNYGLHLWQPEDDFLRSEFNENNEAVDAAIRAVADGLSPVKLLEVVTQASAQQISLDLSNIDWTAWDHILVRTKLLITDSDNNAFLTPDYLLINGSTDSVYQKTTDNTFDTKLSTYIDRNGTDRGTVSGQARTTEHIGFGQVTLKQLDDNVLLAYVGGAYRVTGYQNGCGTIDVQQLYVGDDAVSTLDFLANGHLYQTGSKLTVWGVK